MAGRLSLPLVELGVQALGPLAGEVVFVGAGVLPAWITDSSVLPLRETVDSDCVIDATTKASYDAFGEKMRKLGLREDAQSRAICRWRAPESDLIVDVMPANKSILGFEGTWMRLVPRPENIESIVLSTGAEASIVRPELLTVMKLEAFASRGRGDFYASKDFEDLVSLVRGRPELVDELRAASRRMRAYVADQLANSMRSRQFAAGVEGAIRDVDAPRIVDEIVMPRFSALASVQ